MSETILPCNKIEKLFEPYLNTRNFKHICYIRTERGRWKERVELQSCKIHCSHHFLKQNVVDRNNGIRLSLFREFYVGKEEAENNIYEEEGAETQTHTYTTLHTIGKGSSVGE